jgi:hypothetical protein
MSGLRRTTITPSLLIAALVFAVPASAQTRPPIAEEIAKTYGLDSFDKIEAIRFTFNIHAPNLNISRSWVWRPKTSEISYSSKDKDGKPVKATYYESQLGSAPANVQKQIEPAFLNDQYNLIFPFHIVWDSSADVQDLGTQESPLGKRRTEHVVVKYSGDGGYTPGDTWELFVGPNHRIDEFTYHRGGSTPPKLVQLTWAGYKKAGPLLVSTDRRGTADGTPAQVTFTDVAVMLEGSKSWLKAR